jgi:CubicO group peptidase (beta-lactamase class C family)
MKAKLDITKPIGEINKDIINFAADKNLEFTPGDKYSYCNTNYILLGLIIESLSKQNLADFYEQEFFAPFGMKDTRLITLEEAVQHQIKPELTDYPVRYFVTPSGMSEPVFTIARSAFIMIPFADGGVISTTEDLVKWHKALHSGKILSEDSYKLMIKKHFQVSDYTGYKNYIGYGMYIAELENGEVVYHHAGRALAIRSESGYIPSKKLYYAVLSNVMSYVPKEIEAQIDMDKVENQLDIRYFIQHIYNAIR